MLLLFINHRSVESSAIKKSIEQTYSTFLPKGGRPFVYLSLEIDPQRVDVNVHPTKREVNFLNEEEIIEAVCSTIRVQLSKVDTSRTFLTQALLPPSARTTVPIASKNPSSSTIATKHTSTSTATAAPKPLSNALIRTDPALRKITSMLPSPYPTPLTKPLTYTTNPRPTTTIRLTTVKSLRAAVRDRTHAALTATFASHTYVGLVDPTRRIVAIQAGVKLLLVDYGLLCREYFYQLGLTDFGNFGLIRFEPALDIRALVELGVRAERTASVNATQDNDDEIDWTEIPSLVTTRLISHREMLLEYFSLDVSPEGLLHGIPLLIKGYNPSMGKLPRFLMRLGPCVDWEDEEGCFRTFLEELATFYAPERMPGYSTGGGNGDKNAANKGIPNTEISEEAPMDVDTALQSRTAEIEHALEHVLFPAFRARLVATRELLCGVVEVADLKGLYRVFERC